MESSELLQILDQARWLLNNGLVTDSVKNQLFFYGSIVHKDMQAVEVKIQPENKVVEYTLYVTTAVIRDIAKYHRLSGSTKLFDMWRFKRLLKKQGCLDFHKVLSSYVTEYCGPKWSTKVEVIDFNSYVDKIEGAEDKDGAKANTD